MTVQALGRSRPTPQPGDAGAFVPFRPASPGTPPDDKYRSRFLRRVVQGPECWEWGGTHDPSGYSQAWDGKRNVLAHRWAFELLVGPIPKGLVLDHLCRNRGCVNPDHLEAVTQRENLMRGKTYAAANAEKTHCPQGHPYDEANTYRKPRGDRECRICRRERERARSGRRKKIGSL